MAVINNNRKVVENMEVMQFKVYGELYGIEVKFVKEIMVSAKSKPVPDSHDIVEGVFKQRDTIITVIDLPYYLSKQKTKRSEKDLFMITNFGQMNIAFRVHSVEGILKVSSNEIKQQDSEFYNEEKGASGGIVESDNELMVLLDIEKIVEDISTEIHNA